MKRVLLGALVVVGLSATTLAQAPTPTAVPRALLSGFAAGNVGASVWTSGGTAPTAVWVAATSHWGARIQPANNTASYLQAPVSGSGASNTLALRVRLTSLPALGENRLGEVRTASATMAILTLGADGKVHAYYGDQQRECTLNSLYRYTTCTDNSQCPIDVGGGNPGEATCGAGAFGVTDVLPLNTDIVLAVVQSADPAGARPSDVRMILLHNGVDVGSKTRWQGTCTGSTGGLLNTKACGATADCTTLCSKVAGCSSGGTCSASTAAAATAVRIGTTLTDSNAMDVTVTEVKFAFSAVDTSIRYSKVVPLWPTADPSPNEWADVGSSACANHFQCEDDTAGGGVLDADVTTLQSSTLNETELWGLTDYTLGEGEHVVAATAWGSLKETNDNSNNSGKLVKLGLRNASSSESLTADIDLTNFDTSYRTFAGPLISAMPGGGTWDVNALRGLVRYTGSTGVGFRVRASAFVAEVEIGVPVPPLPEIVPNVNGGSRTVCLVGDSITNDPELYEAMNSMAPEADDILRCAVGGRKIGDLFTNWESVMDGSAAGPFPCVAERGVNAACDVAFVHIGANDFYAHNQQIPGGFCFQRGCVGGGMPGTPCKTSADCSGGTCTDNAGPQQGDGCQIPNGTTNDANTGGSWIGRGYCVKGDHVGECCAGFFCTADCAGGPRGCVGGTNDKLPCTGPGDCSGGTCLPWSVTGGGSADAMDDVYGANWCSIGAATSPECPKGVCTRSTSLAYMQRTIRRMMEMAAARHGTKAIQLVLVTNTDPCRTPPRACVGGANYGVACTSDAGCPSGVCRATAGGASWANGFDRFRNFGNALKAIADKTGTSLIDLNRYFFRRCSPNTDACLRDCIHHGVEGQTLNATLHTACLDGDPTVPEQHCRLRIPQLFDVQQQ